MQKIIFLSVIFLILFFAATDSFACSCNALYPYTAPLEEKVKIARNRTDAIFSGKVLGISVPQHEGDDVKVRFKIDKIWKGELSEIITITTPSNGGMCGYKFKKGKSYLVYAFEEDNNQLGTNICSRTKKIGEAKEELKILEESKK